MVYVATRAGLHHNVSEDAVLVGENLLRDTVAELPVPEPGFVCVADGVGGNLGGSQASQLVLNGLAEYDGSAELDVYLHEINNCLIAASQNGPAFNQMATTLTGFCFEDTQLRLVHVGNTRAYIKQGNYLKQISTDHTVYQYLKSRGLQEDAENCNKNEITNCFGGGNSDLLKNLYVSECPCFGTAVLTSDGVHEYVSQDEIEEILSSNVSWPDKSEEIIRRAKNLGSEDDMTVVIVVLQE